MSHVPRLYRPGPLGPGPLTLDSDQARRLVAVMRLREGDRFLVFAGDGREWDASLSAVGRTSATVQVHELARQEPSPAVLLETWIGLVRASRFDSAIEKCVEGGADVIRPLISDHAARGEGESAARRERWSRIAIEAAEQCGRLTVPPVEAPVHFSEALARLTTPLVVADASGVPWAKLQPLLPTQGRLVLAVGPEGGWSETELAAAHARGALRLSLGRNVLRTETAATVATAVLRSLLP